MEAWPKKHRLTVDEYYRMAEMGLLAPDARVELIEGEIIDMAPMGSDHAGVVNGLARRWFEAVGQRAFVRVQSAVRLDTASEPEPDLAIVLPRDDDYVTAHPSAADVLLLIEVADTTLRYDRDVKVPLYARHGIAEVWVVDLRNRELRWYRSPQAGGYADQGVERGAITMKLDALPDVALDLTGILAG